MNRVTINDIARAAGVSKSTVSRVLNDSAVVHPDKKKAVLEATKQLKFKPSAMASGLARGRSMTIGVLTQLMGSPFFDTIAQGVILGLHETGYSPIFVDGQWQPNAEREALRALIGRRVDGLILIGGSIGEEELTEFCGDLPTVIVARALSGESRHCIYMDNVQAGYLATRHLIDRGHRQIAIVKGLEHHPDAADRLQGYQRALGAVGLEMDPALIQEGDFSAEAGIRAVERLLAGKVAFTGVIAANDLTAFGVRLALYRHGIGVPDEVSIVGFDDQLEASYMIPPLTTIRQPGREMGSRASRAIVELIQGKRPELEGIEGVLIERESVASCQPAG